MPHASRPASASLCRRVPICPLGRRPLLCLLSALLLGGPQVASGMSPLPFTPSFAERVESTFFEGGEVSAVGIESYRSGLAQRRAEVHSVFAADLWALGRGRKGAERRALRRKVVQVYDLLLGSEEQSGWLDELARERDPVAARRLAGRILEVDYALLVEGDRPFSQKLPEHLSSIGWLEWSVPGSTRAKHADREASNLFDPTTGLFYEAEDLRRLIEQGRDISRLDPPPDSSFWQDRGAIAKIDVVESFHRGGHPIHRGLHYPFPETGGVLRNIKKSQTKPKFELEVSVDGKLRRYKLKVGGEIHSEPVTGALLSTLGFNADVTQHVKNFRVDLGDVTVEELRNDWRSYFEFKRLHLRYRFDDYFEVGRDERGNYVIAKEGSLTAKPDEVTRVGPWPWGANGNEGLREARALGILSVWFGNTDMKEAENNKLLLRPDSDGRARIHHLHHDLGHAFGRVISEQINAYPWDLVKRRPGSRIRFSYHSTWDPTLRKRPTYADARWMLRQIAQLEREQIAQAVALGQWPEPVARLLVEKLIHRRNQLVEAFALVGESTPSGAIALLPVDRELTTDDGEVVDGALVDGVFEGSTKEFDNYWEEFLGPVWEATKLFGVATFQKTIGMVPSVIFDDDSVGLPKYVVLDLLITMKRTVVENPRPTSEADYFLVQDELLLGLKVGGGLIGTGTTAFYRSYTLVQPAGTLREAHFADDTILNVLLPRRVRQERLPEEYVLLRESYVDGRIGVITESTGGNVTPVGARASLGRVRLSRSVLERKDGTFRAYRDLSRHTHRDLEAFVNLIFTRIPLAYGEVNDGGLSGVVYTIPADEVDGTPEWSDALSRLVRDGDFSGIETLRPGISVESTFRDARRWFRIPAFFGRAAASRFDAVRAASPGHPDEVAEAFVQYRTSGSGHWSFLDWGEDFRHVVRATARVRLRDEKVETPVIVSTFFQRDRDTSDHELNEAYLGFINGLRPREPRFVDFTPSLHSENGLWGDLEVKVRIGYTRKALDRLRKLDPEAFWMELGAALGIDRASLERYRRWLGVRGKLRHGYQRRVPAPLRTPLLRAERMLRNLRKVGGAGRSGERMRLLADTLSAASFRRGGWYDPTVLAVLHGMLGRKQVSIEAVIEPPPWVENRLVGRALLGGATRREGHRPTRELVDFDPKCTAALWEMLDTFPEADGPTLRWPDDPSVESGDPCDGSRGAFTR